MAGKPKASIADTKAATATAAAAAASANTTRTEEEPPMEDDEETAKTGTFSFSDGSKYSALT